MTNQKRRSLLKAGLGISLIPIGAPVSASSELIEKPENVNKQQPKKQSVSKASSPLTKSSNNMSVNTVRFEYQGNIRWGVVKGDQAVILPGDYPTTGDFVAAFSAVDLKDVDGEKVALSNIKILSPITNNQRFVCQGANYRKHMEESGMDPDEKNFNMIFTKASSCLSPHNTDVVRPSSCELLDYEVELGIVLKKPVTAPVTLSEGNLHEYVAGALIVNDISARDIQVPQMQFYKGKSFRTFGPAGPFLCLLDKNDIHYLDNLQLTLKVNGEVRQSDSTRDMVYRPAETLTELSQVHDFAAGDLLATGTPAGCALSVPSPAKQKVAALLPEAVKWKMFLKMQKQRTQYLQPGDEIETTIKSPDGVIDLGMQKNKIVQG